MNQTVNNHSEREAPEPAEQVRPMPDRDPGPHLVNAVGVDFDIADEFRSEAELAESWLEPSPLPAQPPSLMSTSSATDAPAVSLSIADLLENSVPLESHEVVAIAERICEALVRDPVVHQSLIDPRDVEITEHGEVRVKPGPPSGDPAVQQVGRILGALLQDAAAPAQLRLVASQAAFEVPVYGSVNDLFAALRRFEHTPPEPNGGADTIRFVFKRGLRAKFGRPPEEGMQNLPLLSRAAPSGRTKSAYLENLVPSQERQWSRLRRTAITVAVGVLLGVVLSPSWGRFQPFEEQRHAQNLTPAKEDAQSPVLARQRESAQQRADMVSSQPLVRTMPPPVNPAALDQRAPQRTPVERSASALPAGPRESVSIVTSPLKTDLTLSRRTAAVGETPDIAARRAAALLAAGRRDEADLIFDSIVLSHPLYHADPMTWTPEAAAALSASKRDLLPAIARRDYESARAALDAGDFDRALVEGKRVERMLEDRALGVPPAGLNTAVQALLSIAAAAKLREENRVYTVNDAGITPPAALGRHLPVAFPFGVTKQTIGKLEMLIDRHGEVEVVKLHTPLNRYHERMIVSAAKAWRYRPALKDGKPVRFTLVISITLPESSDDN